MLGGGIQLSRQQDQVGLISWKITSSLIRASLGMRDKSAGRPGVTLSGEASSSNRMRRFLQNITVKALGASPIPAPNERWSCAHEALSGTWPNTRPFVPRTNHLSAGWFGRRESSY